VDGLEWWVPAPATQSDESIRRMLAKQGLPYRAISQTRDFALGGVMLDLGANIGATAIPRAVLGDAHTVICAEPDPLNYECLVANVVRNGLEGLVLADRVAIGDHVGPARLSRGKMPGSHRVLHESLQDGGEDLLVPSITLDRWVTYHEVDARDVTFVKIDTQGSEAHVLNGAQTMLSLPHVTWQIEIAPRLLRLAGSDPAALYALLRARFTHFIDLNPDAPGERLRPIGDLGAAIDYLERGDAAQTDLVLYHKV
jgi:FkbM family methyltransferase